MAAMAASSDCSSSGVAMSPLALSRSLTPKRRSRGTAVAGRRTQIVAVVLETFAHFDHVRGAFGRQQRDRRPFAPSRALVATVVP